MAFAKLKALLQKAAERTVDRSGTPDMRNPKGKMLQFLIFCDFPGEVDPTDNRSERKLRPRVIQRKVTNGYRAMWAAQVEADVRTTVDKARLKGANPVDAVLAALA